MSPKRTHSLFSLLMLGAALLVTSCKFEAPPASARLTNLVFAGLQDQHVDHNESRDLVIFNWDEAINEKGRLYYELYLDGTQLIYSGTDTFYQYAYPNPEESRAMVFHAKACDDDGCTNTSDQIVVVNLVNPNDTEPPVFDGILVAFATAEDRVELHWEPSPSSDVSKYNVYHDYDLNNPVGSTVDNHYVVKNLSPNSLYRFVVRAVDASGNEEKNVVAYHSSPGVPVNLSSSTKIRTHSVDRPDFRGLIGLENLEGVPGLTRMRLRWLPSPDPITGYRIYYKEGENLFNLFSMQYGKPKANEAQGDSPTATDSAGDPYVPYEAGGERVNYAIVDLGPGSSGVEYNFVVRAFTAGTPDNGETNRLSKVGGPFDAQPPTFQGLTLARAADGDSGFDTGYFTWNQPAADGVFNKFKLFVEPGSCSQPFTGAAFEKIVASNVTETTFGGTNPTTGSPWLSPATTYRAKVHAMYDFQNGDPSDDVLDSNETCMEFFTQPDPPDFAGIAAHQVPANSAGFSAVQLYWTAAEKSFSFYVIEIATDAGFSNIVSTWTGEQGQPGYNSQLKSRETESILVTGLPVKTDLYARMKATFVYALDPSFVLDSNSLGVVKAFNTTPPAPENDGIDSLDILNPATLRVNLAEPTNKNDGANPALYNRWHVWKRCGGGAQSAIQALDTGSVTPDFDMLRPLNFFNGKPNFVDAVTTGEECCYQARAKFDDSSNVLYSISARTYVCGTATLVPPAYAGPVDASNPDDQTGFTTLAISWQALAADENFSRWQVQISDDPTIQTFVDNPSGPYVKVYTLNQAFDNGVMNGGAGGLTPYTTYYARVRGVHEFQSAFAYAGAEFSDSAKTEPARPLNDNVALEAGGATTLKASYTIPATGLWNSVFLAVTRTGNASDEAWYNDTIATLNSAGYKVPLAAEIDASTGSSSRTVTLGSSVPALVRIQDSAFDRGNTSTPQDIFIKDVLQDTNYKVHVWPAYWVAGAPENYTEGNRTFRTAQPEAVPPTWGGFEIVKDGSSNDFDRIQWVHASGPATGECTGYKIWVSADSTLDYEAEEPAQEATGDCETIDVNSLIAATVDGTSTPLEASTNYWVLVKAFVTINTTTYYSTGGTLITHFTAPDPPDGDGVKPDPDSSMVAIPEAPDRATLAWTNPSTGSWNKIMVFKAVDPSFNWNPRQNDQGAARLAAIAKANAWPAQSPDVMLDRIDDLGGGAVTTWQDNGVVAGQWTCYVVRAAMITDIPSGQYVASINEDTFCGKTAYSDFTFAGAGEAEVFGTCPDGTAQFKIKHKTPGTNIPAGASIDSWDIWWFESDPDAATVDAAVAGAPWQNVPHDDTMRQHVMAGCDGQTRTGLQYFVVRARFVGGPVVDTNKVPSTPKDSNTNNILVPKGQGHFAKIPASESDLGYDFYMMAFEASVDSGNDTATEEVTQVPSAINRCATQFHVHKNANHSVCRSAETAGNLPSLKVKSVANAAPALANWHNAYWACRNSSVGSTMMRLPTLREWRAAARYSDYTALTNQTVNTPLNCNIGTGTIRNTRQNGSCVSHHGLYDVAGNVTEWVDARMTLERSNYTRLGMAQPVFGWLLGNGIDSQGQKDLGLEKEGMRFTHIVPPGTEGLALQMGSHFETTPYQPQPGPEAQRWLSPLTKNASSGFRCVAFNKTSMPTMDQLALPEAPQWDDGQMAGAPLNKFPDQERVESISINGTVGNSPTISMSFYPWVKKVCDQGDGSCTTKPATDLTYYLYRTHEPNRWDERFVTSWAKGGAGTPYALDTPLDPFTLGGGAVVDSTTCTTAGPCTLTDPLAGAGDDRRMWMYLLVVKDAQNNLHYPMRQRFRTPYLAQLSVTDMSVNLVAMPSAHKFQRPFRTELGWRRASVYAVDENYQRFDGSVGVRNVMVHVPMDKSGLDRDFYIQKYEPTLKYPSNRGSYVTGDPLPYEEWNTPLAAALDTHTWVPDLSECLHLVYRKGAVPTTWGGDGPQCSVIGSASTPLESLPDTFSARAELSGLSGLVYGESVRFCSNSSVQGHYDGAHYFLRPQTSSEFYAASDWGDTDLDGVIDDNPYLSAGTPILDVIQPVAPSTVQYTGTFCNTYAEENLGVPQERASGEFSDCISRYGAVSMVGNRSELTLEMLYEARIRDNGVDAAGFGAELATWHEHNASTLNHRNVQMGVNGFNTVDLETGLMLCKETPCATSGQFNRPDLATGIYGWSLSGAFLGSQEIKSKFSLHGASSNDRPLLRGGGSIQLTPLNGVQGRHSLFSEYAFGHSYWTRCVR